MLHLQLWSSLVENVSFLLTIISDNEGGEEEKDDAEASSPPIEESLRLEQELNYELANYRGLARLEMRVNGKYQCPLNWWKSNETNLRRLI
jgi:hypothetical protein